MTFARAHLAAISAESGLNANECKFLVPGAIMPTNARNTRYHEQTKTTPFRAIYGRKQNLLKFRTFGCRAYLYLNEERCPAGKQHPRAVEGTHLGFATDSNTSGYVIYILSTKKKFSLNQVRCDELLFLYSKNEIINKFLEEEATSALRTLSTKKYVA
jgi:hypothetical protein